VYCRFGHSWDDPEMVEGHRDSPWSSAAWKPPSHGPTHDRLATSPHAPNRFDQTEHTKLANAFPTDLISRCPTFSPPYPRLMHPSLAHRLLRPLLNRTSPWMTFFVDSGGVGQVLGIICRRGRSRGGPASPTAGLPCVRSKKPPRPLLLGTASIYSVSVPPFLCLPLAISPSLAAVLSRRNQRIGGGVAGGTKGTTASWEPGSKGWRWCGVWRPWTHLSVW
jgi:hypothetical protein